VIAFTHATVLDGSGGKPAYDQTLVVDKGRIALGGASRVKIPAGTTWSTPTARPCFPAS
jgi:enamidase